MAKKYIVDLNAEEQEILTGLIVSGTQRLCKVNHARILLKAVDGRTDHHIQESLDVVSVPTIERVHQRFMELHFTPRHGSGLKMDGIEFSVLSRQCLSGHIPNPDILASEVLAWETEQTLHLPPAQEELNLFVFSTDTIHAYGTSSIYLVSF
jgi:hypothetical protein